MCPGHTWGDTLDGPAVSGTEGRTKAGGDAAEISVVLVPVLGTSIMQVLRMDPLPWVTVRTLWSMPKAKDPRSPSRDKSNGSVAGRPGNTCYPR